ncbi:MAG TPA: hypothetical protein VMH91_01885 [Candidatus Paceibacterota bacterium]|nr:hypothetical protein [Candidatus Paceibacterota bacterium]
MQQSVWRPLTIGTFDTIGSYFVALAEKKRNISDSARATLTAGEMRTIRGRRDLELVLASLPELGFKKEAAYKEIAECAKTAGLYPCPPEVGPSLSLQYDDQPNGEIVIVAMNPIFVSQRDSRLFAVGHGHVHGRRDSYYLAAGPASKNWALDRRFVFTRGRL